MLILVPASILLTLIIQLISTIAYINPTPIKLFIFYLILVKKFIEFKFMSSFVYISTSHTIVLFFGGDKT
jgi:hypothetical protein